MTQVKASGVNVSATRTALLATAKDKDSHAILKASCATSLEKIKKLLAVREPFYRQADVLLNCEQRSPREVAQHVAHQFRLAQPKSANTA